MLDFSHKTKVFKSEPLQTELNNEGFVVIDFLNTHNISVLLEAYYKSHPNGVQGFYTSTFAKDKTYRKEVDELIQKELKNSLETYFENYKIHCGSYIVKGADEKSVLKMHQDMTLVDESKYTGINIWIPLVDLTKENGAIAVVPKSHRLFKTYRGASIPDIYDGIENEVHRLMQPHYLKAGQAIVFDQSIIHFSPSNKSGKERPVINTFITHQEAGIKICYWNKDTYGNKIEVFEQAEDFMTNFENFGHDIFSRPSIGQSQGFVEYDFPKITSHLLQKEYGLQPENQKERPKNFFKRLFS